jgi:predicted RecA/RadA family phage recombinase
MADFVSNGRSIDYTPGSAVTAGAVVLQGDLIGVASNDIAANKLGSLQLEGEFSFTGDTGANTDIALGAIVFWDNSNAKVAKTDASGANKRLGKTTRAKATTDSVVYVKINI